MQTFNLWLTASFYKKISKPSKWTILILPYKKNLSLKAFPKINQPSQSPETKDLKWPEFQLLLTKNNNLKWKFKLKLKLSNPPTHLSIDTKPVWSFQQLAMPWATKTVIGNLTPAVKLSIKKCLKSPTKKASNNSTSICNGNTAMILSCTSLQPRPLSTNWKTSRT